MLVLNLVDFLDAKGVGNRANSLFVQTLPAHVRGIAILFRDQGGPFDPEIHELIRQTFQVFVRDQNYSTAYTKSVDIMRTLTLRQTVAGSSFIYECYPRHQPLPLGREDTGFYNFVVNYDAVWRRHSP